MAPRISAESAKKLFLKNKLRPLEEFVNTQKPWRSECLKCGKTVSPNYAKVKSRGHQCAYCAGSKVDPQDAVSLLKSKGFIPKIPYPGGNNKWLSVCTICKKELEVRYTSVKLGFGCKFCTGKEIHPQDAKQSIIRRGFKPLSNYPGASSLWRVKCITCKREQKIKMHSVKSSKRCAYCAKRKLDLIEVYRRLSDLDFQPLDEFKNARTPWRMRCLRCKHIIFPTWDSINRQRRGRGCGYCSQVRVDLKDVNRLLAKLALKPLVKYPGGKRLWKCKCLNCGSIVYPKYNDLNQGQGGCSNCADYGLNYSDKGYLYLITHPLLNAHKIGIANLYKSRELDDRMHKHRKQGWKLYKTKDFSKLRKAYEIEQQTIYWLRVEVGLPMCLDRKQMPQGGYTETVDASEIDLKTIWAKVEQLSRVKR